MKKIISTGVHAAATLFDKISATDFWELEGAERLQLFEIVLNYEELTQHHHLMVQIFKSLRPSSLGFCAFQLCEKIIAAGDKWAAQAAIHFDSLGLRNITKEGRLDLCLSIGKRGPLAASALITNFKQFGLNNELTTAVKWDLCKSLLKQWGDGVTYAISSCLKRFDLESYEVNQELRIELCFKIASGPNGAWGLANHCKQWDVRQFEEKTRLKLYQAIISQGESATRQLIGHLSVDDLQEFGEEEYFDLLLKMIGQGQFAVDDLAENELLWPVSKFSLQKRLALCHAMIDQGSSAVRELPPLLLLFKLNEASELERVSLLNRIKEHPEACESLIRYLPLLQTKREMEAKTISERMQLCKELAITIGAACGIFIHSPLDFFLLPLATVEERLKTFTEMASWGNCAATGVAGNLKFLNLKEASALQRIALARLIASQGKEAAEAVLENAAELLYVEEEVLALISYCAQLDFDEHKHPLLKHFETIIKEHQALAKQIILECSPFPLREKFVTDQSKVWLEPEGWLEPVSPIFSILLRADSFSLEVSQIESLEDFVKNHKNLKGLEPILGQIKNEKPFLQPMLYNWAAYTAGILYNFEEKQIEEIEKTGILEVIYDHKRPANRYQFSRLLRNFALSGVESLQMQKFEWTTLTALLLSPLNKWGLDAGLKGQIIEKMGRKGFHDLKSFNCVVQYFLAIHAAGPFSAEETNCFATAAIEILNKKGTKKQKKLEKGGDRNIRPVLELITEEFDILTNFIKIFGSDACLTAMKLQKNLKQEFQNHFKDISLM